MDSFLSKDCFKIPPYPISDAADSTIKLAFGFIKDRHEIDLTRDLIFWTVLMCSVGEKNIERNRKKIKSSMK